MDIEEYEETGLAADPNICDKNGLRLPHQNQLGCSSPLERLGKLSFVKTFVAGDNPWTCSFLCTSLLNVFKIYLACSPETSSFMCRRGFSFFFSFFLSTPALTNVA
ncbi:hypothetical protein Leryth_023530 [Lithospermum erythrorhizon]|nr:hypothetical protein Leryth_023530 [Lithospermum erythrorhizon]